MDTETEMSLAVLRGQSYLSIMDFKPDYLVELAKLVAPTFPPPLDTRRLGYFMDILEKIGFMFLARDAIQKLVKEKSPIIFKYHFYMFIFACKAYLDAIACFLNDEYELPSKGGDIDLGKGRFIEELGAKNAILAQEIQKHEGWIRDVIEWRDSLIHKYSIPVLIGKTGLEIPGQPIQVFEYFEALVKHKLHKPYQDPNYFCQYWIQHAVEILEILCEDTIKKLSEK